MYLERVSRSKNQQENSNESFTNVSVARRPTAIILLSALLALLSMIVPSTSASRRSYVSDCVDLGARSSNSQGQVYSSDGFSGTAWVSQFLGEVRMYAGSSIPNSNWSFCDGQAISRSTYSALFRKIGTTYGVGDGSTTFNLPDMRGRAPVHEGTGAGLTARTLGEVDGEEDHVLTASEMPPHSHAIASGQPHGGPTGGGFPFGDDDLAHPLLPSTSQTDIPSSSGDPHSVMQPFIVLNYIIRIN